MSVEYVYNAIRENDLAGCVESQLAVLRNGPPLSGIVKHAKDENVSISLRNNGNAAFRDGDYQQALILYNRALLYAPNRTLPMKLAYSNRSALWLKLKCFTSCVKDIDTCMAMGCPPELIDKLNKRKEQALKSVLVEDIPGRNFTAAIYKDFFKLKSHHTDIHNVSGDIKMIREPDGLKLVAARDINVGTILAVEAPFVSSLDSPLRYLACHYCQKLSCNLIPCDGCCFALYCDDFCKQKSFKEDHGVLCPIVDFLSKLHIQCVLATKAVIKMRQNSMSWKTFLSTANEDVNKLLSNKSDDENRYFVPGKMFTYSECFALIIHYLDKYTNFFPCEGKKAIIHALSKMLMNISLHASICLLSIPVCNRSSGLLYYHNCSSFGLYTFMGKLKQACTPNVYGVLMNREATLVSVLPIKEGTELTISHIGHWMTEETNQISRARRMFFMHGLTCTCAVCTNGVNIKQGLNDVQTEAFQEFNVYIKNFMPITSDIMLESYKKISRTLQQLSDSPYSVEYRTVFRCLCERFLTVAEFTTGNIKL